MGPPKPLKQLLNLCPGPPKPLNKLLNLWPGPPKGLTKTFKFGFDLQDEDVIALPEIEEPKEIGLYVS